MLCELELASIRADVGNSGRLKTLSDTYWESLAMGKYSLFSQGHNLLSAEELFAMKKYFRSIALCSWTL